MTVPTIHRQSLVWDAHGCLPLEPGGNIGPMLERYCDSGVNFVSVNIGMDFNPVSDVIKTRAYFGKFLLSNSEKYVLIGSVDDILDAQENGLLAVVFDQEEMQLFLKTNPEIFPPGKNYDSVSFVEPEQWPEITQIMIDKGYPEEAIRGILGRNWFRVAKQVWK